MLNIRLPNKLIQRSAECCYSTQKAAQREEFRALNLKHVKNQVGARRAPRKIEVLPARTAQMAVDQDWGNVWPGSRSFHPATVPLPIRQGYVEKGVAPDKYANAELIKIPNFLHLTPPVIKRQCEALKRFCTAWPKGLETDEKCENHFPLQISSSDYCHSLPTIRNPLARIVSIQIKLARLGLNDRARDKFRRLVGERYDEKSDLVTIVADRCPLRQQNYEYAMYLLTALSHEARNVEEWEREKSDADMEIYVWDGSASQKAIQKLCGEQNNEKIANYAQAVADMLNEGENQYNLNKYGETVRRILALPQSAKAEFVQ